MPKKLFQVGNPGGPGGQTKYDPELALSICAALAASSRGLDYVCRTHPEFPTSRTIISWAGQREDFKRMFDLAYLARGDVLFEECLDIADDSSGDLIVTEDGRRLCNTEFVQRSRVRIDTRKWMAGKINPKKYGERSDVNVRFGAISQEDALRELG